jgi:hypothetical protein
MRRLVLTQRSAACPGRFVAVIRVAALPDAGEHHHRRYGPAQLWRLSRATVAVGGARALLSSTLAAMGVRRLTVYCISPERAEARSAPVPGVTVSALSERQVAAYLELRPDTPGSEVVRRLQAGALCVGAWRDGRLVAARWLETDRPDIEYLGVAVGLRPGVWYAYDAFTEPAERRLGVSALVTAVLMQRAVSLGATFVINAVLPENRGGRALARSRSQRLGLLGSLRIGPWRVVGSSLPAGYVAVVEPLAGARRGLEQGDPVQPVDAGPLQQHEIALAQPRPQVIGRLRDGGEGQ